MSFLTSDVCKILVGIVTVGGFAVIAVVSLVLFLTLHNLLPDYVSIPLLGAAYLVAVAMYLCGINYTSNSFDGIIKKVFKRKEASV